MVQVLNRSSNAAPLSERVQRKNESRRLAILRAAARDDYRWSSIILAIVNSTPFAMRHTAS